MNTDNSEDIAISPAGNVSEILDSIKARDPGFNEQQFLDRASTAFFKVQNAWCDRDMNKARAYISDNVLRRFSLQLEEHKRNKVANKLEELSLDNTSIMEANTDENFDTISVWMTATAKDYMVSAET